MRFVVILTTVLLVYACFLNSEGRKNGNNKTSLKVLTYNVWFTESNAQAFLTKETRKKKIINALEKSDADLVCLQEVFTAQDVEDIVEGVKENFPFAFSASHKAVNDLPPQKQGKHQPPCDSTRITAYLTCVITYGCANYVEPIEFATCLLSSCLSQVLDIFENESQQCRDCVTTSSFNTAQCAGEKSIINGRQMNDGGIVLLSKKMLHDASYNAFYPNTRVSYSRGYIQAEVDDIATVVCTHLTSVDFLFFEPELEKEGFKSYADMNLYEVQTLIKSLRGIEPAVILGDFNTGYAFTPKLLPEAPESYLHLLRRFTTRPSLRFSYRRPSDSKIKKVVDHVFVKNLVIRKTKRVFVPKDGEVLLSDHCGVQSVVKAA